MNADQALDLANSLLAQQGREILNDIESTIFREVWGNRDKTYKQIARETNYTEGSIDTIAHKIWKRLSDIFGVSLSKSRLRQVIEAHARKQAFSLEQNVEIVSSKQSISSDFSFTSSGEDVIRELTKDERRAKYQQALELVKAAGSVENRNELALILDAFRIYKQLDDIEQAANLLLRSIATPWQQDKEPIGAIAYRLGVLAPMSSAMNWLIEKVEAGWYLPANVVTHLYNEGGDLIWMSSNNTLQAIPLHQVAQKHAYKSYEKNIIVASEFNQALCNIDRGEVGEIRKNIYRGHEIISSVSDGFDCRRHEIAFGCISAYIETLEDKKQAGELAEKAYATLLDDEEFDKLIIWEKNNLPLYVAKALQNIGSYGKAFEMYMEADRFAKSSGCVQVEAHVLVGKALLCYLEDGRFTIEKSISWLLKAKKIFEVIEAEGDKAQVNLFLGVMFRELGKLQESQKYFSEAEKFYTARDIPKKIIMINRLKEGDSLI